MVAPVDAGSGPYGDLVADRTGTVLVRSLIAHADSITRLKVLGVFDGTECEGGNFCPDDPVDHATFSVWLMPGFSTGTTIQMQLSVCCSRPGGVVS